MCQDDFVSAKYGLRCRSLSMRSIVTDVFFDNMSLIKLHEVAL
jgi:hypothetical protein